jgi:hypothetical protein
LVCDDTGQYFVISVQKGERPKVCRCGRLLDLALLLFGVHVSFHEHLVHHSPYVVFVNCPVCLGQLQPNTVIPWRFILAPLLTAMCNPPVRWAVPTDLSKSLVKASDLLRPCTRYIHHLRLLVLISVSGMSLKPTLYLSLSVACSRPLAAHIGFV